MSNESDMKGSDDIDDSEAFFLPLAPPPPPVNSDRWRAAPKAEAAAPSSAVDADGESDFVSNGTSLTRREPSSLSDAGVDSSPVEGQSVAIETPLATEDVVEVERTASPENTAAPIKNSGSAPFVLVLCSIIIGLLIFIANKNGDAPAMSAPIVQSSGVTERELISAREEVRSMREKMAELTLDLSRMKNEADAMQSAADSKIEEGVRNSRTSDDKVSALKAEVERLNQLVRSSPAVERKPVRVAEVPMIPQAEGTLYRVSGLYPGDTLNVRSGPSVQNPVVNRLQNGVKVRVIGRSASNGPDTWLPCLITGSEIDSNTGLSIPWQQKGWINSMFVEEVSSP